MTRISAAGVWPSAPSRRHLTHTRRAGTTVPDEETEGKVMRAGRERSTGRIAVPPSNAHADHRHDGAVGHGRPTTHRSDAEIHRSLGSGGVCLAFVNDDALDAPVGDDPDDQDGDKEGDREPGNEEGADHRDDVCDK